MSSPPRVRPLAPAHHSAQDVVAADSPTLPASRTRKNVSKACTACRSQKKKCSGIQPCESCLRNNLECIIDVAADNRSHSGHKRKLEALEQDRDLLVQLVGKLRDAEDKIVAQLLNIIRTGASFDEIKIFLDEEAGDSGLTETAEMVALMSEIEDHQKSKPDGRARAVLDVKRLSDIPPFQVPARPWTNVSADNDFVSHLVSLWFSWAYPVFFTWIDRETFIKDMRSANLNAQYCSPFLVNIMLADACAFSDYPEALAVSDDPFSKGAHFLEEAKRHLDSEGGRISISTVQGMCILWIHTILQGRDRQGFLYQNQIEFAVKELVEQNSQRLANNDGSDSVFAKSMCITLWGIFNVMTSLSTAYQKPQRFVEPKKFRLPIDHKSPSDRWYFYPSQVEDSYPGHVACHFNSLVDLSEIAADMNRFFFPESVSRKSRSNEITVDRLYQRLQIWLSNLSPCLAVGDVTIPPVMSLHMYFHTIVQTIFGLARIDKKGTSSRSCTEMTQIALTSAKEVSYMTEKHCMTWGNDRMPVPHVQWITIAMFTLLDHLDEPKNSKCFVHLCIAARAFSRRWPLAKGMLRLVQLTARQRNINLCDEAKALFIDFEQKTWSKKDRKRFSSSYPNFFALVKTSADKKENIELDKFLERWDDLVLTDETKGDTE